MKPWCNNHVWEKVMLYPVTFMPSVHPFSINLRLILFRVAEGATGRYTPWTRHLSICGHTYNISLQFNILLFKNSMIDRESEDMIVFSKAIFLQTRRYSESMLNPFIQQLDGKMRGNQSTGCYISSEDARCKCPGSIYYQYFSWSPCQDAWLILAGPGDKAAELLSLKPAIWQSAICIANMVWLIAINTTISTVAKLTYSMPCK